jgi:hypothetical protein
MVALLSAPLVSAGTIVGSAHDFSARGWGSTQLCIFCHTPHNASTTVAAAPLWNHASSVATYTLYSSATMNATVGQPGVTSRLCLSCHDGTVAIDSFAARTGTTFVTGGANLGTNLSNDHPIGILYNAALVTADGGLADPATTTITIGSGADVRTGTINAVMLFSGNVECASCHDVHNKFTVAGGDLLKYTMTASGMCMQCHRK